MPEERRKTTAKSGAISIHQEEERDGEREKWSGGERARENERGEGENEKKRMIERENRCGIN